VGARDTADHYGWGAALDAIDSNTLSVLEFIISALTVGVGSLAVWVWRRGWHVGRVPRE